MASHYLRYALYRLYRAQIVLTLVVFAVGAVLVDIAAAVGLGSTGAPPPSIAFALFFTGCVLWVGYWFGFRIVYWVEARPDRLAWRTTFRSGSLPINDVRAIYSSALLSGMGVVRTTKGRIFIFPPGTFLNSRIGWGSCIRRSMCVSASCQDSARASQVVSPPAGAGPR